MGDKERWIPAGEIDPQVGEALDSRHFYDAYVFDRADSRLTDVQAVLENATRLGYPVRYWWLSDAMDLQGCSDRLIVCVHHTSAAEDAGMDLYNALRAAQVDWDDLDAAVLEEYICFGRPVADIAKFSLPGGSPLFPQDVSSPSPELGL